MKWYIADTHFGHKNVIAFNQRPFSDVDEMDRILMELWNAKVNRQDDIYVLGDFAFRNEKPEQWYLKQLNGIKHLIVGNHDGNLLKNETAMGYFETVEKMEHVSDQGNHICLCHFPICEWNGYYKGHWHIYGHIHNRREETYNMMKMRERALNAGVDINYYSPSSFKELVVNNERFKNE